MLTRKTSTLAQSKRAIAIPLLLVCVLCFTKNAFSDDKRTVNGNKVTFKGNVFTMKIYPVDTTYVTDPTNGQEKIVIRRRDPRPIKMNSEDIVYDYEKDETGAFYPVNDLSTIGTLSAESIIQSVINEIRDELVKLPDGQYNVGINNVVLNKKGEIAYYDFAGFQSYTNGNAISEDLKKHIDKKIITAIDKLSAKPATMKGKPVIYMTNNSDFFKNINIEKGKILRY